MKYEFEKWMKEKGISPKTGSHYKPSTASQYKKSIDFISRHYSQHNKKVDLYNTTDILFIKKLAGDYGTSGRYKEFGQNGNGTVRAAITAYAEFLEYKKNEQNGNPGACEYNDCEYIDDRGLKRSIEAQVEELFPGYRIFKKQNEKKDISVLENTTENELLIIELKAGTADDNVVAPILNYCGLLSKEFPDKKIRGIIIAGGIDESLVNACSGPMIDIGVMKYKIKLNLERVV